MMYQAEEKARVKRQRSEQAIQLALQSRWQEAIAANQAIISLFPSDVDAYNRLGKALTELGRYREAREAYDRALALDPGNGIARKNLDRLAHLEAQGAATSEPKNQKVDPHLFIEETGKTGVTTLYRVAPDVLARMTAGDRVQLRPQRKSLVVENARGEYVGEVEPRLGLRLLKLIEGGNQYDAAIASLAGPTSRLIIKEVFQHPSQAGKLSFPPVGAQVIRPYTKERLLRHGLDEETEDSGEEEGEEWETESRPPPETEAQEGDVRLYEYDDGSDSDDGEYE
jgi:tetratricopeptide (TPR) repeat protein